MTEGEVLGQGDVEEVGEIGDGDGTVGPGACTVYFVSISYVCWRIRSDVVGIAAVSVVGQVVAKGNQGAEWISAAVRWAWC